jgi:cell division protein FtsB
MMGRKPEEEKKLNLLLSELGEGIKKGEDKEQELEELKKRDEENFEAQIKGLEEEKQVLEEKKRREKVLDINILV